ncbi:MAG: VWA domain-containing protein [Acidobacteria bacterium]|nr:VWA domain-containing protein [Acidobacteriota bacterium]
MIGKLLISALTVALLWPPTERNRQRQEEAIKIATDLVTLTVTVFDEKGRSVANLKKDDFTIFEDNVRQELSFFTNDEQIPVSIGIVFDTSGSMVDKMDGVQDAVKHFIETTKKSDEIFLLRFSREVSLVCDFTDQKPKLYKAVESLEANGNTALYDAVYEGLQKVAQGKHKKKAILLITDGNDTASDVSFREVVEMAKKAEVLIYGLGIGHGERRSFGHLSGRDKDEVDINILQAFSDTTGGRSYLIEGEHHLGGEDQVDKVVLEVGGELRRQYSLGYYPTNKKKDGGYRSIKVQVAKSGYSARVRRGYFAAQKAQ